jgi:hypothetical protein
MLFEKVTKEHILQGITDFEEKGLPNEFGPSSTYDLVYEGKKYPPKAIMAYANYYAEGRAIGRYFKGGLDTDCFKAFDRIGLNVVKKEITAMNEKLHKLKQEFLDYWPLEKLQNMTLEEYTDTNRENSFCYWLEHITRDLGSIVGGSSYKFGIYKRNSKSEVKEESNRTTDGEYAWFKKYGEDTKEEAFKTVKSIIIKIAKATQNSTLDVIDTIDLGNAYKWKIAFLYGDYNCVNMFKLDALRVIASNLEIDYNNKTPISYFQQAILKLKPEEEEYFTYCHALWQQYQERLIDVKKDFAKWLNKNTFESYRAYLGNTSKSIEEKLDEINDFFDEVDFFLVDPKKVNGVVSTILFLMSKKERVKNPEFVDYDSKNSNGIPKAILGKNNYIKFLKERFDYIAPNYWVFQGNPKIYNITSALKAGHLKSWKVAAHKEKIKIGDQVVLWQTGNQAGCYALAEVTSKVNVFEEESFEQQYYINPSDNSATERVKIKIVKYLAEDPILWEEIKSLDEFKEFKGGNQGTNFSATKEEYNTLLSMASKNHSDFQNVINRYSKDEVLFYFEVLDKIVEEVNLKEGDNRLVFSTARNHLNLTVGQRFAWRLTTKSKEKYCVISDKIINELTTTFDGAPMHYYSSLTEKEDVSSNIDSAIRAIEIELKRSKKSSYRESNNEDFERAVFDKKFREQFIKAESMGNNNEVVNKILYGPPGTGKTFYLKDQLFDKYTSKETSISQEQNFETVVSGCSWWQVIAIALLDIGRSKVSDVFEHEWVQKKASLSNSKTIRQTLWGQLQSHTIDNCEYVNVTNRQTPQIFTKSEDSYWKILEDQVEELVPELYELRDSVENYNPDPDKIIKHYDFVTFHQSFAYEDFIEGIKPIIPEIDSEEEFKDLGYTIEDGVFKNLCRKAKIDPENRYAIFIDEINRGNVSAIFGELITLIETDKRSGAKNELSIKLPYSKKNFSVPSNLDIYGTMNTADRSVEALDTALRRRFEFKEMMPDYRVIKDQKVGDIQLSEVLQTINERIEILVDRDHTIGHSYFINVNSKKALANAFNNKIVPLLQEYFYGDYGKIGLVLGEGFVKKTETKNIEFATFKYDDSEDFKTPKYNLIKVNKSNIITAIETLLGKVNESSED